VLDEYLVGQDVLCIISWI